MLNVLLLLILGICGDHVGNPLRNKAHVGTKKVGKYKKSKKGWKKRIDGWFCMRIPEYMPSQKGSLYSFPKYGPVTQKVVDKLKIVKAKNIRSGGIFHIHDLDEITFVDQPWQRGNFRKPMPLKNVTKAVDFGFMVSPQRNFNLKIISPDSITQYGQLLRFKINRFRRVKFHKLSYRKKLFNDTGMNNFQIGHFISSSRKWFQIKCPIQKQLKKSKETTLKHVKESDYAKNAIADFYAKPENKYESFEKFKASLKVPQPP